jgi:hypothetical protein
MSRARRGRSARALLAVALAATAVTAYAARPLDTEAKRAVDLSSESR